MASSTCAAIGDLDFKTSYVNEKVSAGVKEIAVLAEIAKFHPQSADCAYTAGFCHKFNYFLRTIPDITSMLQPPENIIRNRLIPSLLENRTVSDEERNLISLLAKLGGLEIPDFTKIADIAYMTSRDLTSSLICKIVCQHKSRNNVLQPASCKFQTMDEFNRSLLSDLRGRMSTMQIKANDIACSVGASIWLTFLPLKSEGQKLSKREFVDAIYLRYGWQPSRIPLELGGFLGSMISDVRDYYVDNFRFPTL